MKKKTLLAALLVLAPFCQTTRPMDYTTVFYLASGLFGAYGLYKVMIDIKNSINETLEAARIISERLNATDLFYIKDTDERFKQVTNYFSLNSDKINNWVHPYSPKADARKPLFLAQQIGDDKLVQWFKDHGAQEQKHFKY